MEIDEIVKKLGDKDVLIKLLDWIEKTKNKNLNLNLDEYSDTEIEDTLEDLLWWLSDVELSEFIDYII